MTKQDLTPILSDEQVKYKAFIVELERTIKQYKTVLYKTRQQCKHIAPLLKQLTGKYKFYGYVNCVICDDHLGWACPDSPDRVCHYESQILENGKRGIVLIDGQYDYPSYLLQEDYDEENEDNDYCIYCSKPEERK